MQKGPSINRPHLPNPHDDQQNRPHRAQQPDSILTATDGHTMEEGGGGRKGLGLFDRFFAFASSTGDPSNHLSPQWAFALLLAENGHPDPERKCPSALRMGKRHQGNFCPHPPPAHSRPAPHGCQFDLSFPPASVEVPSYLILRLNEGQEGPDGKEKITLSSRYQPRTFHLWGIGAGRWGAPPQGMEGGGGGGGRRGWGRRRDNQVEVLRGLPFGGNSTSTSTWRPRRRHTRCHRLSTLMTNPCWGRGMRMAAAALRETRKTTTTIITA